MSNCVYSILINVSNLNNLYKKKPAKRKQIHLKVKYRVFLKPTIQSRKSINRGCSEKMMNAYTY